MVAYWPFDGQAAAAARDLAGEENAAKPHGSPPATLVRGLSPGGALAFVDSGQKLTGSDAGFPAGPAPGSISLWFCRPQGVGDKVLMLADGNGDFARALGLDFDGSGIGFGIRSQRYALVADDGVVKTLAVDKPMTFEVSSAEAILKDL